MKSIGIYPEYECDTQIGKTQIKAFTTRMYKFEELHFVKKIKRIAKLHGYVLKINNEVSEMLDLDTLYDLIKANLVVKE